MNRKRKAASGSLQTLLCGLLLLFARNAWTLELQTVLDSAAITPPARVGFREERHNKMLKDTLVLTGYLEYLDDRSLRKVVQTPFEESFLINEDRVEIERSGKTRTLSLNRSRALKTILVGIEAILAGRADRLERAFNWEVSGSATAWILRLTPRSRRIAKQLNGLLVTGTCNAVKTIRFDLDGGEWHLMQIGNPDRQQ